MTVFIGAVNIEKDKIDKLKEFMKKENIDFEIFNGYVDTYNTFLSIESTIKLNQDKYPVESSEIADLVSTELAYKMINECDEAYDNFASSLNDFVNDNFHRVLSEVLKGMQKHERL